MRRKLVRHRHPLVNDRNRVQNRIKSDLSFYGQKLASDEGSWSLAFLSGHVTVKKISNLLKLYGLLFLFILRGENNLHEGYVYIFCIQRFP